MASKVNKNKFMRYYKLQQAGTTKMSDFVAVAQEARLTKGVVLEIQKNYKLYRTQFVPQATTCNSSGIISSSQSGGEL